MRLQCSSRKWKFETRRVITSCCCHGSHVYGFYDTFRGNTSTLLRFVGGVSLPVSRSHLFPLRHWSRNMKHFEMGTIWRSRRSHPVYFFQYFLLYFSIHVSWEEGGGAWILVPPHISLILWLRHMQYLTTKPGRYLSSLAHCEVFLINFTPYLFLNFTDFDYKFCQQSSGRCLRVVTLTAVIAKHWNYSTGITLSKDPAPGSARTVSQSIDTLSKKSCISDTNK